MKQPNRPHDMARRLVAPRAGAWIETQPMPIISSARCVAPRAGAWIETTVAIQESYWSLSRPPRGGVD